MVAINTSGVHQAISIAAPKNSTLGGDADSVGSSSVSSAVTGDPQISGQAKILSSLYGSASDFVKSEYLEAYSGSVAGNVTPGAYIDIGKYNYYLFSKAAATMVASAKGNGITLDKADVLAQLKSENSYIASIKFDDGDRKANLGSNNVYSDLSASDLDNLTNTYITAQENGLDASQVEGLALQKGVQNHYGSTLQEGDIYPYDWDYSETDPDKIAAAKNQLPDSIMSKAEGVNSKLQGDLGLGNDFIQFLLNPKIGLRGATDSSLEFLSKLTDIYNQQK